MLRNLGCRRLQCDEIWSFVYAREPNVPRARSAPPEAGDVWTWICLDADTRLIVSWLVGDRSRESVHMFMEDIASRLAFTRVQMTTDGLKAYPPAVRANFERIDYGALAGVYGLDRERIGARQHPVQGRPNRDHISTSYVECQNLTIRMSMRRFTRKTNAFSKKVEHHVSAFALHSFCYNFCRIHSTLRQTPAIASDVTHRLWHPSDIVEMVAERQKPGPRGPYRKRQRRPSVVR